VASSCCMPMRCRTTLKDGHTLRHVSDDTESLTGCAIEQVYATWP
jgi:hypothetical protein